MIEQVALPEQVTVAFSELARITRRELRGLSKQVQSFAMLTLSMGKAMSAGEQKKHLNL